MPGGRERADEGQRRARDKRKRGTADARLRRRLPPLRCRRPVHGASLPPRLRRAVSRPARASPPRGLALLRLRPLHELLEQALLLGRIVGRGLGGLRAHDGRIDGDGLRRRACLSEFFASHSSAAGKRFQPRKRGGEVGFLPLDVARPASGTPGTCVKKASMNSGDAPIAVGVARPVVDGEHGGDGDGVDRAALGDQVRVVVVRQLGRKVVLLQRLRIGRPAAASCRARA